MTRLNRVGNWESGLVWDLGVRERKPSDIHFEVKRLARPGSSGKKDPGRTNLAGLRIVESARLLDAAVERAATAWGGQRIGARASSQVRKWSSDRGGGLKVAGEGDRDRIAGAVERERWAPCVGPPASFCLNETQRPDRRLAMVALQFNRLMDQLLAMLGSCILVVPSQFPQHLLVAPQNSSIGPYWRR